MVDRIGDTYDSITGAFVYHTDYEALEAKLKRENPRMDLLIEIENTNTRLKAKLAALVSVCDLLEEDWEARDWGYNVMLRNKLKSTIAAIKEVS